MSDNKKIVLNINEEGMKSNHFPTALNISKERGEELKSVIESIIEESSEPSENEPDVRRLNAVKTIQLCSERAESIEEYTLLLFYTGKHIGRMQVSNPIEDFLNMLNS